MSQKFVGSYVEDIRLAAIASLVSQEHLAVLGAPGCGKTDILDALAVEAVGKDSRLFLRFSPSTPPERIEGMFDPAAATANPPRFVIVKTGTPYDPRYRLSLLDEWFRASDILFDDGLDVCDRRDIPMEDIPVVWVTSNFAPVTARTAALIDRFPLWLWVRPGVLDVSAIINAHANSMRSRLSAGTMPTWDEVVEIRKADPGRKAIKECADILTTLAQEATKASLAVNNRRIRQWFRLLFRTNVYFQGTADFSTSHAMASKVLTWAWACTDENKAVEWQKIAGCVVDVTGTAIKELVKQTLVQVNSMMQRSNANRTTLAVELGEMIADGKRNIESLGLGDKDPRVKQAMDELSEVFAKIVRGENPFES